MRRHRPRVSNFAAGIIGVVVFAAVCYFVFGGSLPFSASPFVLKAAFTTPTDLHIPSPVRIAGVDVGQVTSVQRVSGSSDAGVVTMQINRDALPIHADATADIRSRIFLEGSFYIDLHPGSPNAPSLSSGATLSASHTAGTVQLDRVLSSLNSDARGELQTVLQGLGSSLNGPSNSAQDATQDPMVRGLTGGEALNRSLKYSADAFKASAIVNQALLGTQPHDLSHLVRGNQEFFRALASKQSQLASLVHTFNATMAALAARQQDLSNTIALLPPVLRTTNSSDTALDASFGPTQAFAKQILPGVEQLDPTIGYGLPWLSQSTALFSSSELGGLASDLTPAVQQTSSALNATKNLLIMSDQLARCFTHNVVPAGNEVIKDGPASTGLQVYQELFQTAVGLAGAAQNFDGNGRYVRASAGGGSELVGTRNLPVRGSSVIPAGTEGPLYGNAVLQPLGTRPAWPGKAPPVRSDIPCFKNPLPNLNSARQGAAP